MTLTARQLNRATLGRQMLLRRERLGVVEAVHRVVALQAQEHASRCIVLWNRVAGFDLALHEAMQRSLRGRSRDPDRSVRGRRTLRPPLGPT